MPSFYDGTLKYKDEYENYLVIIGKTKPEHHQFYRDYISIKFNYIYIPQCGLLRSKEKCMEYSTSLNLSPSGDLLTNGIKFFQKTYPELEDKFNLFIDNNTYNTKSSSSNRFPHKCDLCGSAAYQSLFTVECSNSNCSSYRG